MMISGLKKRRKKLGKNLQEYAAGRVGECALGAPHQELHCAPENNLGQNRIHRSAVDKRTTDIITRKVVGCYSSPRADPFTLPSPRTRAR